MQGEPEALIFATQAVQDLLDRGDESAEDINKWIMNNPNYDETTKLYKQEFLPVYFHDIKIFQLEETRDIIDFGTARTFAGNKIIIDYCYHTKGYSAENVSYNDTVI
jgi:hypothetical protein